MVQLVDCGSREFLSRTNGTQVYCFGYGKYFQEFVHSSFFVRPYRIIDNKKYGTNYEDDKGRIPVISVSDFQKSYTEKAVIIICANQYEEILEQINGLDIPGPVTCFIFLFLLQFTEPTQLQDSILFPKRDAVIPRKIHYCWFGKSPLPEQIVHNIETWKRNCPDYEIVCWDESNYDVKKNAFIEGAYNSKKWAFVSDFARLDILYREGGLYLDTDVEMIKSFDDFLGWDFFCGFEYEQYVNFGLGYGAKAASPILENIIKQYEQMEFRDDPQYLLTITCPKIQSQTLEKYGFCMNNQFQNVGNMAVYPKEFFSPIGYIREFGQITPHTYSIHQYGLSWTDQDSPIALSRISREEEVRSIRKRYLTK